MTTASRRHAVEAALLALVHVDPAPLPRLGPAEWEALLALAARERVGPLAYRALQGREAEVPDGVRSALRSSYEQASVAVEAIYRQAAEVQRSLRAAGIPALLFKGAALARFTYHDDGARPFSDIDLLVRRDDVGAVHRALRAAGYDIIGGAPTEADLTWRHGRAYYDPHGIRVPVDVHWRYLGYPLQVALDYEEIFARAAPVSVGGEPALVLSPTDHVVASAVATLRELWYSKPRLRYLRDTAELTRRHEVDWLQVMGTPRAAPLLRSPLYVALAAAARLLGAPVPASVIDQLRPRGGMSGFLTARIRRMVLRREHPAAAVLQVGMMRWLDGGPANVSAWIRSLLVIPGPLAASRRRWLRHLWEG